MNSVNHIADYFIRKADPEAGDAMTHLKLQKLVYYAQGWHLALFRAPLFQEPIEAWPHGPTCPALYSRFRDKSWDPILADQVLTTVDQVGSETQEFLDEVWEVYGPYGAKRLEEMTHAEKPWKQARFDDQGEQMEGQVISHTSMREYFASLSEEQ